MPALRKDGNRWQKLLPIFNLDAAGQVVVFLKNSLDLLTVIEEWKERVGFYGMYEVLDYDATLELVDLKGETAVLVRNEVIRLLQDNVIALYDHAWGDGDIFAEYHCDPGVPVDFYRDGSRHNVLISLRETKNRGDVIDFRIERTIQGGFLQQREWLETEIDHPTKHLKIAIVFPKERRCQEATLTRRSNNETVTLGKRHFSVLADDRQKLTWSTYRPKLHDLYTIKWRW